ncbi:MAG: ABC transporter ATP-binding protein [Rhodocyclaceae bacterium]|nr:ABC transporter ATP-binding protein [Rhodocyclaceae bacterium]
MATDRLLEVNALDSRYGALQALFAVDLRVAEGETVAIVGANGAGKSTLLKSIMGLIANRADQIRLRGQPIGDLPAYRIALLGVTLVPEGRRLFPSLSVEENLLLGGRMKRPGTWSLGAVYTLFPALRERRYHRAQALSGGQRQMAAFGRALMANPCLLLIDEASLGLAPLVVKDLYAALPRIRAAGTSLVVVEQDLTQALGISDRVYCLQEGRVALHGRPAEFSRAALSQAYFGAA